MNDESSCTPFCMICRYDRSPDSRGARWSADVMSDQKPPFEGDE